MLKNKLIVAALASAFSASAFAADAPEYTITPNIGFVSNYVYRGLTQTSHAPALQGGVDYARSNGFYAGLWGSGVRWIHDSGALAGASDNAPLEVDTYFGIKNPINDDVSYDVGLIRYNYLGSYQPAYGFNTPATEEVYGGLTYKWISLKYSYGLLDGFLTIPGAKGTDYIDLSASYTLEGSGVTLGAHAGKQNFKGKNAVTTGGDAVSYEDYKLSASKDFSGIVVGLNHTWTNATNAWVYSVADPSVGNYWGKHVTALTVTKSF